MYHAEKGGIKKNLVPENLEQFVNRVSGKAQLFETKFKALKNMLAMKKGTRRPN